MGINGFPTIWNEEQETIPFASLEKGFLVQLLGDFLPRSGEMGIFQKFDIEREVFIFDMPGAREPKLYSSRQLNMIIVLARGPAARELFRGLAVLTIRLNNEHIILNRVREVLGVGGRE